MNYRMQIHSELASIPEQEWNSLVVNANNGLLHPGLRHEYLSALESSGSACPQTGWAPIHLTIHDEDDQILGAIPLYLKSHSYGEYVFDWSWAQAYERHGLAYYPKLLSAIPFTPIQGPKLLFRSKEHIPLLVSALAQFLNECIGSDSPIGQTVSSFHALFLTQNDSEHLLDAEATGEHPFMERHVVQFHWQNIDALTGASFQSFDHYLNSLAQKKRKNIRAERRKATDGPIAIKRFKGTEVTQDVLSYFYQCYVNTYAEHFSTPYMTQAFFQKLLETMPENVLLIVAFEENEPVACSFFLYNEDRLYGRYWGSTKKIACMHFELCYYQAIEFAIEKKIQWFEGGAQGEHKMARGLNPLTMKSAHWVADPGFKQPIARFLDRERDHLTGYVGELQEHQAFKHSPSLFD